MKITCTCAVETHLAEFPALPMAQPVKCTCGEILLYDDIVGQIEGGAEMKYHTGVVRFGMHLTEDDGTPLAWEPALVPVDA